MKGEKEKENEEAEAKDAKAEDYLMQLKYLQAEFENYKKRTEKEKEEVVKFANEDLILELIDIYENLQRAVENKKNDNEAFVQGVEIIYKQFKELMEKEGVTQIKALGEKFDPFKHEVVEIENKDDCEENIVLEEYQKGYALKDKVIRYSKVKISKRGD